MPQIERIPFAKVLVTIYREIDEECVKKLKAIHEDTTVRKANGFTRAIFTDKKKLPNWCPFIAYPQILTNCVVMRCPIGYSLDSNLIIPPQAREGMFYDLKSQPLDKAFLQWIRHPINACNYCRKSKI
jgi:hypothetical protein